MKILMYIFVLSIAITAQAQINQNTANHRRQYPMLHTFEIKQVPFQNFQINFRRHENQPITASILSTEHYPKPSTHSIQKAFNYYNSQKKRDYSAVLMMGYSLMTNRNIPYTPPQESIRFFPGNTND